MLDAEVDSVEVLQQGLKDIASWLDEPLCQRLVNLHANDFFTLIPSGDAVTINFEDLAPWCQLPQDWRLWIEHHIDHMHLSLHLIVASAVCHGDISELVSSPYHSDSWLLLTPLVSLQTLQYLSFITLRCAGIFN